MISQDGFYVPRFTLTGRECEDFFFFFLLPGVYKGLWEWRLGVSFFFLLYIPRARDFIRQDGIYFEIYGGSEGLLETP